ncbi:hypothetical protein Hanom_Chr06g00552401 [Helianthus anomalus]
MHCCRSVKVTFFRRVGDDAHVVTVKVTVALYVSSHDLFPFCIMLRLLYNINCDEYKSGNCFGKVKPLSSPINPFVFPGRFFRSSCTHLLCSFFYIVMADPSNPHSTVGENPEPSSLAATKEEEGDAPDGGLTVLKWSKSLFENLMMDVQMPSEYGAIHPQEGETIADAPAGYVTMWADFSYTFHALGIEPTVGDFRWFCQMTVSVGFFSFRQRDGSPKLMVPPKGMTKWKTKFFYIKAAAIPARLAFRNVTDTIITETIRVPQAYTVDCFPRLRIIRWKKLSNSQCWVMRMMLERMSRKARPVVREKSGENDLLWRIFDPGFKGKVEVLACADAGEGFNFTIHDNFQLPAREAMEAMLPQGKGDLGALGDPDATGVPKQHVEKHGDKRLRKPKKPHEPVVVPPLVQEVAGISRGGAAVVGSSAGSEPADDKKRKGNSSAAGGPKGRKLRRTWGVTISELTHAFITEPQLESFSFLDIRYSPPRDVAVDVGVHEERKRSPSTEVVTPPSAHAEGFVKKVAGQMIADTLDLLNNLIDPQDSEVQGGENLRSPDAEKPNSLVAEKSAGSTVIGTGVEDQPSIHPGETELEFYYHSWAETRSVSYYRPPWTIMQGDDIRNDPSAFQDILSGLGTPFEVLRARGLPRENRINQTSSMLATEKAAREGAEQLERKKAAFEKLKQTETLAATAGLKQVRTLAKLLSDEHKGWREACARQNEKLFRVRQELTNLKAANAALAEAPGAQALEEAVTDRNNLNKAVEDLKNRVTILEEVTARPTKVKARAREATEARDSLTTSLNQLRIDRDWMRDHDIGHIVGTILDALENATASKFTDERSGFHGVNTEARYVAYVNAYKNLSLSAIGDIEQCLDVEDYVDRLRLLYEPPEEENAGGDAGTSGTKED